jgi:hypothetical protein
MLSATQDQELKQESDQDQKLRQEIELIVERLHSECVPRIYPDMIVREIMDSHPAPEGERRGVLSAFGKRAYPETGRRANPEREQENAYRWT